jgi:hypothetical protein
MVADNRERCCESCVWWEVVEGEIEDGEFGMCRRFPPQIAEPGVLNGVWPVVRREDWCGEHDFCTDI